MGRRSNRFAYTCHMFRAIESRSINYDHVMYLLAFVLAESCGPASVGFAGISRCTSPRLLDYGLRELAGPEWSNQTRPVNAERSGWVGKLTPPSSRKHCGLRYLLSRVGPIYFSCLGSGLAAYKECAVPCRSFSDLASRSRSATSSA